MTALLLFCKKVFILVCSNSAKGEAFCGMLFYDEGKFFKKYMFFKTLFTYLRLWWVFMRGLFSSCSEWELLSSCGARASHCGGFSCGARALGHTGFSSYGTQT